MNCSLHIFVLFFLQYFASHSTAIQLEFLDFYYGENHQITSDSGDYKYPLTSDDADVDIIWQCRTSIKLEIKYFELDGQNGDFLMISDVPLDLDPFGPDPTSYLQNITSNSTEFIDSILVSNGLLLSWSVNQSIQIHSEYGTFIYFHAQRPEKDEDRRKLFKGFDITVLDYDALRTTTLGPTPEPELTTPSPGTQIYLTVFLSCNEPQEFLKNKDDFKEHLADLANQYCNDTGECDDIPICNTTQNCTAAFEDFTKEEVNIPDEEGLFYCNREWPEFEVCVEVRFAIVRRLSNGTYIMTKKRLGDMWKKYSDYSREKGYCPFNPPDSEEFRVWVWVAFILGMILVLSALLWVIWIKISSEDYNKISTKKGPKTSDEDNAKNITGLSDQTNPFLKFFKKWGSRTDDAKYSEMLGNIVDSDGPPTVRQNQLYHKMHGAQDNFGYTTEEVEVEFQRPPTPDTLPSVNRFSPGNFMDLDQEHSDIEI